MSHILFFSLYDLTNIISWTLLQELASRVYFLLLHSHTFSAMDTKSNWTKNRAQIAALATLFLSGSIPIGLLMPPCVPYMMPATYVLHAAQP